MDRIHHSHRHFHSRRAAQRIALPEMPSATALAERALAHLVTRATSTSTPDECETTKEDLPQCRKPTTIPTLPIVLGIVIPVVGAAIVWIWLHRRHRKKLAEEDAKDKYKSLDFGADFPPVAGKKDGVQVTMTEKTPRKGRGISMDLVSPYIMPTGLNGSRESLHSLSRSMQDPNDPYRPVAFIKDNASVRSQSRNGKGPYDNGSLYTTRTASSAATDLDHMNNGLLNTAQGMPQSAPPRGESLSPDREVPEIRFPEPAASGRPLSPLNPNVSSPPRALAEKVVSPTEPKMSEYVAYSPTATSFPPAATGPPAGPPPPVQEAKTPVQPTPSPPPLPRIQSQAAVVQLEVAGNTNSYLSESDYGEGFKVTPPSPPRQHARVMSDDAPLAPAPLHPQKNENLGLGVQQPNNNRLSIIARPLPPDDPNEDPEVRANRIRSFYKEYFDDSKPEPAGGHFQHDYVEDYGSEYLDGSVYDPHSNAFVIAQPNAPFAEPVTRRAMTPPPRAPPRFNGGGPPRGPHMSKGSVSSHYMPPRGMSSMSGRMAAPAPRKPVAPPQPLATMPTPSMLKDDFMMINNPIDFAPPVSYRDRQNGLRPDSPMGAPRPFSPAVRPHTPLMSSFDDLAVIPSPHLLRNSGTFTSLDFAPPPRFRDPGSNGGSDAGSIRSNRSGMSAAGRMAIRTGAYRVSRIPKEVVGTKDDITSALRPQMSMVSRA